MGPPGVGSLPLSGGERMGIGGDYFLTLTSGGVAGDGGIADEGDEEGEGHAACGISYVAHQHGGYGATYYRHNEEGGEM